MKVTTHTARILLGLIFFVLGLNPFLHFLPARLPSGLAGPVFESAYTVTLRIFLSAPFSLSAVCSCL